MSGWRVPAALRGSVAWLMAYDHVLPGPGLHRGLPTTGLSFVLPVEVPIDVGWAGREETRSADWSCVSGLHPAPAEIRHHGRQAGVMLELTPAGARAILGIPAAALAGEMVTLEQVSPRLRHLPEQLAGLPDWESRARHVEQALITEVTRRADAQLRPEVGRALARLTRGARVGEVADEVGWSRRHLSAQFRDECGVTPKQYHRLARFQVSRDRIAATLTAGERPGLARVAAECGYADQAHLTREWAELAGCTPSTWVREEFPFVQDSLQAGG